MALLLLQFGHGFTAVDKSVVGWTLVGRPPLQFGHGFTAVDNNVTVPEQRAPVMLQFGHGFTAVDKRSRRRGWPGA